MKRIGLIQPEAMMAPAPALATAAPPYPPRRACDEELGSPSHQVMRFQTMAPISAARMTLASTAEG